MSNKKNLSIYPFFVSYYTFPIQLFLLIHGKGILLQNLKNHPINVEEINGYFCLSNIISFNLASVGTSFSHCIKQKTLLFSLNSFMAFAADNTLTHKT